MVLASLKAEQRQLEANWECSSAAPGPIRWSNGEGDLHFQKAITVQLFALRVLALRKSRLWFRSRMRNLMSWRAATRTASASFELSEDKRGIPAGSVWKRTTYIGQWPKAPLIRADSPAYRLNAGVADTQRHLFCSVTHV